MPTLLHPTIIETSHLQKVEVTPPNTLYLHNGTAFLSVKAVQQIRGYLHNMEISTYALGNVSLNEWTNNEGKLTKRIRKFYRQDKNVQLSDDHISEIGNIARADLLRETTYFDIVNEFDWKRTDDFGMERSCWWNEYPRARGALHRAGGFCIRIWRKEEKDEYHGYGRMWLHSPPSQPYRFIGFNHYGERAGTWGRMLSNIYMLDWKEITLHNNEGDDCLHTTFFINDDTGLYFAPAPYLDRYSNYNLDIKGKPSDAKIYHATQLWRYCYGCETDIVHGDDYFIDEHAIYCSKDCRDDS